MLCYVGKATKIFFFIVAVLAAVGLFIGLGVARHGRDHKAAQPGPCQGGGGNGPCSPITSLPATAAAVPPPPQQQSLPVGPAISGEMSPPPPSPPQFLNPPAADVVPAPAPPETATAAAPPLPPITVTPPSPVPPTATAAALPPVTGQDGPGVGPKAQGRPRATSNCLL